MTHKILLTSFLLLPISIYTGRFFKTKHWFKMPLAWCISAARMPRTLRMERKHQRIAAPAFAQGCRLVGLRARKQRDPTHYGAC